MGFARPSTPLAVPPVPTPAAGLSPTAPMATPSGGMPRPRTGVAVPTLGPNAAASQPKRSTFLSTEDAAAFKSSLTTLARQLREEQLKARVVYVDPNQQTNEELDAITEAVVADLQSLQLVGTSAIADAPPHDLTEELTQTLVQFLDKLLSSQRRTFRRNRIEEIQRRITALFFNAELHSKVSAPAEQTSVAGTSQALFIALKRHERSIVGDLNQLKYSQSIVREEAIRRLQSYLKELQLDYLSATTPELERLLKVFKTHLLLFFRHFRKELQPFASRVITDSRVGRSATAGYKIPHEAFDSFRSAFDEVFLELLEVHLQLPVLKNLQEDRASFRDEVLQFVVDPHIFSEICAVVCDACYDFLHDEGYLDLPAEWRASRDRTMTPDAL